MSKKKIFVRFIALMCTIMFLVNQMGVQVSAEQSDNFMELTFSDFGVADGKYECPTDIDAVPSGISSLDGVAISGKVKFSFGDGVDPTADCIRIGGTSSEMYWYGLTVFYADSGIYLCNFLEGHDEWYCHIPADILGVDPLEQAIDVRFTFRYENESDVYFTFSLNGVSYYEDMIYGGVNVVGNHLLVAANSAPIELTSTKTETEYEELTLSHFGIDDGTIEASEQLYSVDGSLRNTTIDAIYNFSTGGNAVYFGNYWEGFCIEPRYDGNTEDGSLAFMYVDLERENPVVDFGIIEATDVELSQLKNTDLSIKVSFAFYNETETTTYVKVTVCFENGHKRTFHIADARKEILARNILFWSDASEGANSPLGYASITEDNPGENPDDTPGQTPGDTPGQTPGETPQEKPKLTTVSWKEMGVQTGTYKYTKAGLAVFGQYKTSLMNTVSSQKITLSKHTGTSISYAGGPSEWHGIRLDTTAEGALYIYAADGEFPETYEITKEIAGTELLGKEIELKLALWASGKDAMLGVSINGQLCNDAYYVLTGAKDKLGSYMSIYIPDEKGWVQIGEKVAPPTLNRDFKRITFASYDIDTDIYRYTPNDLSISGHCGLESLDKVIFSDTINFSNEPGTQLLIGGKEDPWHAMVWESVGDGKIYVTDGNGIFAPMLFDSETAGVKLSGKDIQFTLSFEYVDADGDGSKDDVKMGVWFNEKCYGDRWFYLKDSAKNLGGYIGIYCSNKKTSLSIKTYMEPIAFEDYGFTKKWKEELELQ